MDIFYIATMKSFFKSYYTEKDVTSFSTSIRKATSFITVEAANKMIIDKKLKDCFVMNQFGQEQVKLK